jgi:hypothetical protein
MKFFLETTEWTTKTPNHLYLMSTDKTRAYGYMRAQDDSIQVFAKPMQIDIRGRTFQARPELGEIDLDEVRGETWTFQGSRGDVYVVQKTQGVLQCNCPGFRYRGDCKHYQEVLTR